MEHLLRKAPPYRGELVKKIDGGLLMKLRLAAAAVALLVTSPAFSQGATNGSATGNQMLEGCQAIVASNREPTFRQGFCLGVVYMLMSDHEYYKGLNLFCRPANATTGQAIRIVTRFMEENPQNLHLPLEMIATRALHLAWPC
jgi:hypothetical protein